MVTFGAWLEGQKNRQDSVGELARYWETLKGNRRIRALASVKNELEAAGALADGAPTAAWWAETEAAWRAYKNTPTSISGRPLTPVPDLEQDPAIGIGQIQAPAPGQFPAYDPAASAQQAAGWVRGNPHPLRIGMPATMDTIQATLDIHSRFLAAMAVRLGLSASKVQEIWAELGVQPQDRADAPFQPVDWNWLWDHTNFEAAEGEQA